MGRLKGEWVALAIAQRGWIRYESGRLEEAISLLDQSLAILSEPNTHMKRGMVWDRLGDPSRARAEFAETIAGHSILVLDVGDHYLARNQAEIALEYFDRGVQLGVQNARFGCGLAHLQMGSYAKARTEFLEVLAMEPQHQEASRHIALCHAREGNDSLTVAAWEEHLQRHPEDAEAEDHLLASLLKAGEAPRAVAWLEGLVGVRPKNAKVRDELAWILATTNDDRARNGPAAKALAQNACELTEHCNPRLLQTLAAAHAACGEFDEAMRRQSEVLARTDLTDEDRSGAQTRLDRYRRGQATVE